MDLESLALDRIPLPSLRLYTILSFLAASCSFSYFWIESTKTIGINKNIAKKPLRKILAFSCTSANSSTHNNCDALEVNQYLPHVIGHANDSTTIMEYQYQQEDAIYNANYEHFRDYYRNLYLDGGATSESDIVDGFIKSEPSEAEWTNSSLISESSSATFTRGSDIFGLDDFHKSNPVLSWHAIHWASQQPHCVWPLVNLAYCLLILLGHSVQKTVFGNLRASEQEGIKDQFWNLVFYKVVFVFGVVNVQEAEDAIGWLFFVSVIGFLQLARQLCQERHNYLILMNVWTTRNESRRNRILGLLSCIFIASVFLFISVGAWYFGSTHGEESFYPVADTLEFGMPYYNFYYGSGKENENKSLEGPDVLLSSPYDFNLGLHSTVFMLCELGLLVIQSFHALIICIFEQMRTRCSKGRELSEDVYSNITQSINFRFDLVSLLFDLVHHVHMLVCCNLFLSMTSLIVSLQMRTRVRQIHGILKKRQSYLWLTEHIDQYPDAKISEEGTEEENCAICWDLMTSQKAKSLPCHHMFHTSCLRKWLLVSMNCPTCRLSLVNEKEKKYCSMERPSRRMYAPRPVGLWGFLQTGQALLDLFGGWDPQFDDSYEEATPSSTTTRPVVPLFQDFGVVQMTPAEPSSTRIGGETPSALSAQTDAKVTIITNPS